MIKTAEVAVIGGGINGSSIAYRLARSGVKRVVQLEKRHIASGPTGRSSGIVRQHYTIEVLAKMARDSVRVFQNFAAEIGGDAGFVPCGVVWCCAEDSVEAMRKTVAMHHALGIRENLLTADEVKGLDPQISTRDIACGAYEPDGGYADPALAANSFAEAAKALGVEVLTRTRVTALKVKSGRITGLVTEHGELATRAVINVAGPWGAEIAAMAGVHIPMCATRHPVVILQRPAPWRNPTPVVGDLVRGWYFKPERNASLMVGSLAEMSDAHKVDIETHSTVPSYEEIEGYSDAALQRYPVMLEGMAQGGWAGLYDLTPDSQPVIDRVPGVEGFYCAVGFSGHGFKIGPAVGVAMAELVMNGRSTSYDLAPFRFSRFQEGRLTHGAYGYSILG